MAENKDEMLLEKLREEYKELEIKYSERQQENLRLRLTVEEYESQLATSHNELFKRLKVSVKEAVEKKVKKIKAVQSKNGQPAKQKSKVVAVQIGECTEKVENLNKRVEGLERVYKAMREQVESMKKVLKELKK